MFRVIHSLKFHSFWSRNSLRKQFLRNFYQKQFYDEMINKRRENQSWKKKNSRSTTKRKRKSVAENELTKMKSSLKRKQIINKSWRNSFINIAIIEVASFNTLSHQNDIEIFVVSIRDIDIELNIKKSQSSIQTQLYR